MSTDLTRIETVRDRLLGLRRSGAGWGYRPRTPAAVEASALASLALLAASDPGSDEDRAAALAAARWIAARCRRADGSTGVTLDSEAGSPGWTTPFALLLWNALGGFADERRAAVAWLLAIRGKGGRPVPRNPMGHDVTLVGWPWVADTHSWVEPTATSLLALAPSVPLDHPRLREGVRVLLDRAIPTGGWNLGNPVVFGQTLRALPGPTGLTLVALARVARAACPPSVIAAALSYLRAVVERTAAPTSLGWAILGLRAWGIPPVSFTDDRLAAAADRAIARSDSTVELAMLLLASGARSPAVLGLDDTFVPTLAEPVR